jgi:hypothetical protein
LVHEAKFSSLYHHSKACQSLKGEVNDTISQDDNSESTALFHQLICIFETSKKSDQEFTTCFIQRIENQYEYQLFVTHRSSLLKDRCKALYSSLDLEVQYFQEVLLLRFQS